MQILNILLFHFYLAWSDEGNSFELKVTSMAVLTVGILSVLHYKFLNLTSTVIMKSFNAAE